MDLFNDSPVFDSAGFGQLLIHLLINLAVVGIIIHLLYYPRSKRRDYYFTFTLIGISIFLMIFLLGSVKIKVGFALGLFAIFGIIRYRTEQVPIREMTYLFAIIAISVINALAIDLSYGELAFTNLVFIIAIWILEGNKWLSHIPSKLILYDKISLITPDKREELKADLEKRTGLTIVRIEIGHIDFLRDSAILKIYYKPETSDINTIDNITKIRNDEY
jgi:hypothetical protein